MLRSFNEEFQALRVWEKRLWDANNPDQGVRDLDAIRGLAARVAAHKDRVKRAAAVMSKPKIGECRYLVTWIDRAAMRLTDAEDDLSDRLAVAERGKPFTDEGTAKAWAQANAARDEYGSPRLEHQTFEREYPDVPADWQRGEYQEWEGGGWQPLVF